MLVEICWSHKRNEAAMAIPAGAQFPTESPKELPGNNSTFSGALLINGNLTRTSAKGLYVTGT